MQQGQERNKKRRVVVLVVDIVILFSLYFAYGN